MAGNVTESIWNGASVIVPLADVQHIETHNPLGLIVVTRHTRWDAGQDCWGNSIWIDGADADSFKAAWCRYRSELEADTLADLEPRQPSSDLTTAAEEMRKPVIARIVEDTSAPSGRYCIAGDANYRPLEQQPAIGTDEYEEDFDNDLQNLMDRDRD